MKDTLEQYLNANQLAQSLGISRGAIYSLMRKGIIPPGLKIGRSRRWSIKDIQATLQAMKGAINP